MGGLRPGQNAGDTAARCRVVIKPYDPKEADRQVEEARTTPPDKWRRRRGSVVILTIILAIMSIFWQALGADGPPE